MAPPKLGTGAPTARPSLPRQPFFSMTEAQVRVFIHICTIITVHCWYLLSRNLFFAVSSSLWRIARLVDPLPWRDSDERPPFLVI
jgi:hypothetical protein